MKELFGLADLAGNFCSFSESKRTESALLAAIQYFISDSSYVHALVSHAYTYARSRLMCLRIQNVATPTIILKFREENFRDQKSNHEIHENIVPRKFGAIYAGFIAECDYFNRDTWSLKPPETVSIVITSRISSEACLLWVYLLLIYIWTRL